MSESEKEKVSAASANEDVDVAEDAQPVDAEASVDGTCEPEPCAPDEPEEPVASGEPSEFGEIDPELAAEADAAVEGVDGSSEAESELVAAAKAETAEWQDKYMRLHAEWDTYRRRTKEQRAAEKERATESLVTSLLPVLDDFERTITYATENGEEGLLSGVQAVNSKLLDILQKDGLEAIDPAGEAFDALEAQAVATVPDDSVPDETVAQVYQKGYRMGNKVLRPAMVTVTSGGPKRPKDEAADE